MFKFTRREVVKIGAGAALAGAVGGWAESAAAQELKYTPEAGAKLRVLRWKQFVQGDIESFTASTKKFTEQTGVEVRLDTESWEDVRPKAAVAANIGAGPDIIIGTNDDPHKFPDKLVDLSDLADYLGTKYGGWYDVCRDYGIHDNRWIALPQGINGSCINYRISHVQKAGFEKPPADLPNFLKLCQNLKKNGTPAGFALGHATGDANNWTHWCLWSHGGKVVDEKSNVVLDSPETVAALEYAKQLYPTFIDGTLTWLDPSNNKAFLAGECSLTGNGISIYYVAKTSSDPKLQEIAKDMDHTHYPIGPGGKPTEQNLMLQAFVFKYTKYPNAAKEYLRFMWEKEQFDPWMVASLGYISQPLKYYENNPVWTSDPKAKPFSEVSKLILQNGYAGPLGFASAAVIGDFIVVDMFAEAASGAQSPEDAAKRAAEHAKRYYQV
ncbi:MAG TPA: ABC transporter substrate-binding protein [Alphaproteobacteria bacterium]|nr:ABC transporter substrate-binding protein [Alphaproteobacteria bacterium]